MPRRLLIGLLLAGLALLLSIPTATFAQGGSPADGLRSANAHIELAVSQAEAGDLAAAQASLGEFHEGWETVEDAVREQSSAAYASIERAYDDARDALAAGDAAAGITALEALAQANEAFADGRLPAAAAREGAPATLETLLPTLAEVSDALAAGRAEHAAAELESFRAAWPDVEGDVKARSAEVYRSSENDMAAAAAAISAGDLAGAQALIAQLRADLEPMVAPARYGVFDAFSILLREGLEALLVIAALLAFLERTGNHDKRGWIWGGGILGIVASVGAGLIIAVIFRGVATGSNRELIEGISGLIAAAMLFGVSFWLHGKSHAGAWQKYIRERTSEALATGSLLSLGALSFFAIFREGAETALFYIGIASSIATSDLLMGIGIAVAVLAVAGVLVLWVGVRLPLRPFFLVTSGLIFYLGFKFIGTGIHALQVARVLPSSGAGYLPDLPAIGMFPTWQTTLPQLTLLGVALVVVLLEQVVRRPAESRQTAHS
ncbi:FTR1 family protein [Oscillochloris sp. ZM17-4]|uniref:FTR1 family iron permease n=1 Tax=Oscillochloris sp. ZM17-4 TaxID=2866714 RepID=UPI001C737A99|nr:FTR1 family protein [Oscillochloris sp. ZM17-4]MBX0329337.1 FTR1 family protein [Oscillochloris sp. ZM17-4]